MQFYHNDRKIFLDLYDFFKSSSIILWAFKFRAIDSLKYSDNQTIFSSKNSRFQLCLKNCTESKIRIFLIHKFEELLEFTFEDLLICSKNIKEFYITFVANKEPWIYLREKRLGKFYNSTLTCAIIIEFVKKKMRMLFSFSLSWTLELVYTTTTPPPQTFLCLWATLQGSFLSLQAWGIDPPPSQS